MALKLEPQDIKGSCCTEKPTQMITYDCGPDGFETYLVCDSHYKDEAWSRFAISKVDFK